ncbi:TylF/MycF/NovP-related O-methyltransferase [Paenibacillus dokdonensis]|uniref:TylF/MycF/NovP-related O-methyltransferase n=1 Tax=Paenibacillus dokdonensis TaxID=2567944 RepID=UPI001B3C8833|nr:TylF/MycF/NovP-related O-methyltransferase [Paenibacillus dokdonensis]
MYKLLVFGNGGLWSIIKEHIDFNKAEILAFINSIPQSGGTLFEGVPIITPLDINQFEYDFILLASGKYDLLIEQLKDLNINNNKIIGFKMNDSKIFHSLENELNEKINKMANYTNFNLFTKREIESFHLCNMNLIGRERKVDLNDKSVDYVRLSSLELIAEEIHAKNITGNVAELGVYKGGFAKHINKVFNNRKLYLFDTFEGFDERDISYDIEENFSVKTTQFIDTSIDLVLSKMEYPENVIVKKGYFPQTSEELEDQFAFVSIDTDLYKPIYDGLNYFYPRLAVGGYIFVHDYNNSIFKGAKEAVREFCSENSIPYVPISDNLGTVIIPK